MMCPITPSERRYSGDSTNTADGLYLDCAPSRYVVFTVGNNSGPNFSSPSHPAILPENRQQRRRRLAISGRRP